MLNKLSRTKKLILSYLLIALVLICLSCFGLLFNEWTVIAGTAICSVFGFINLILLMLGEKSVTEQGVQARFALYTLLRYVSMALGLVLACLLIHFTMGDEVNKLRYLSVIVCALPYFAPTISLVIVK